MRPLETIRQAIRAELEVIRTDAWIYCRAGLCALVGTLGFAGALIVLVYMLIWLRIMIATAICNFRMEAYYHGQSDDTAGDNGKPH